MHEQTVIPEIVKNEITLPGVEVPAGIEQTDSQRVMSVFQNFFQKMDGLEKKANKLVITDISQTDVMEEAKEIRKKAARIRIDADNARAKEKESSLKKGKFIQSIYNIIEGVTTPIEQKCSQVEKFAEELAKKEAEEKFEERKGLILPYLESEEELQFTNIGAMNDDVFKFFLERTKSGFEAKIEAEKKAEENRIAEEKRIEDERIAKEKAEAEERAKIQAENERLQSEAKVREEELAEERRIQAKKDEVLKKQREKELADAYEKSRIEREAQEKIIAEQKAKADAEQAERERLEGIERDRIEKEHKEMQDKENARIEALNAPDNEKVQEYICSLQNVIAPIVSTPKATKSLQILIAGLDKLCDSVGAEL